MGDMVTKTIDRPVLAPPCDTPVDGHWLFGAHGDATVMFDRQVWLVGDPDAPLIRSRYTQIGQFDDPA